MVWFPFVRSHESKSRGLTSGGLEPVCTCTQENILHIFSHLCVQWHQLVSEMGHRGSIYTTETRQQYIWELFFSLESRFSSTPLVPPCYFQVYETNNHSFNSLLFLCKARRTGIALWNRGILVSGTECSSQIVLLPWNFWFTVQLLEQ